MKVKELIEKLSEYNEDAIVIIGVDASNENWCPMDGQIDRVKYVPDSTYSGYAYDVDIEDPEESYDLDEYNDAMINGVDAVVIFPIN